MIYFELFHHTRHVIITIQHIHQEHLIAIEGHIARDEQSMDHFLHLQ